MGRIHSQQRARSDWSLWNTSYTQAVPVGADPLRSSQMLVVLQWFLPHAADDDVSLCWSNILDFRHLERYGYFLQHSHSALYALDISYARGIWSFGVIGKIGLGALPE